MAINIKENASAVIKAFLILAVIATVIGNNIYWFNND